MNILVAFLVKVSVCVSVRFIFAVFIKSELRAIPRSLGRQTETFGKSRKLIFLVVTFNFFFKDLLGGHLARERGFPPVGEGAMDEVGGDGKAYMQKSSENMVPLI